MVGSVGGSPSARPSYVPPKWDDDEFMSGIMTMLKDRDVNPLDYDKKMDFWGALIGSSCLGERSATFSVDLLKRRFARGSKLPACIAQVVDNLVKSGEVMTVSAWRAQNAGGWLDWGMSKLGAFIGSTSSWLLWGNAAPKSLVAPDEQIVHVATLKKQADRIVELMRKELEADVDGTAEVIAYSEMYEKCTGIISNKTNFDLVLDELSTRGEVSVGMSKGEKIIKFRDSGSSGPASFSESDASVHDIRKTMGVLEKKIGQLEGSIKKYDADARACIRSGDRNRAALMLRRKKAAEKELTEKDGQIQRLLSMLHQIGSSKHNKEVIDAYKAGSLAFKTTLARHGLSPEKIDETMDEVMNATEEYRDIEEALAQPINGIHDASMGADLEDELEALLAADKKEKKVATPSKQPASFDLPAVPSSTVGISQADTEVDFTSLERRLKRLQQAE
ncbi:hypothetical protein PENTCL1PPCAC_20981 [Pristionchus entomophagus]|uniref:CHMP7 winged helix domain-containing protein n=1 Tax=Pristionchus entomophagus TaxID=358040 RepID=A0AAV5TWG6_9BILA|nr:hypothetical protein PENTCL1PPCAC_20981 [Pristionchus entomophagus]